MRTPIAIMRGNDSDYAYADSGYACRPDSDYAYTRIAIMRGDMDTHRVIHIFTHRFCG